MCRVSLHDSFKISDKLSNYFSVAHPEVLSVEKLKVWLSVGGGP